jgi:hypothetical protein
MRKNIIWFFSVTKNTLSATGTLTVYVSVDPTLVWVTNDWTATITENHVVGNIVKTIQATPPGKK